MNRAIILLSLTLLTGCPETITESFPCTTDTQCAHPRVCVEGTCVIECYLSAECESGEECRYNACVEIVEVADSGVTDGATGDAATTDGALSDAATDAEATDMLTQGDAGQASDATTPTADATTPLDAMVPVEDAMTPAEDAAQPAPDAAMMIDEGVAVDAAEDASAADSGAE